MNLLRLSALPRALLLALLFAAGAVGAEPGTGWDRLTAPQKQALAPLQNDWPAFDATRQQKWLAVAARFPSMSPDERKRLQDRMSEWARLTPAERERARLQFQETRELPSEEKQALWHAYQALSDDERKALALRAKPAAGKAASAAESGPRHATGSSGVTKSNLVVAQPPPPSRAVSPSVVTTRPGATTTTVTTRANPPAHHQPGMPKITATPGFVDQATLLPQRGPQGAAVRQATPSAPPAPPAVPASDADPRP